MPDSATGSYGRAAGARWIAVRGWLTLFTLAAAQLGLAAGSGAPPPGIRPEVVAHRGDSCRAPENTLAAFASAVAAGADAVELDVQLSRDDRVIVMHDATVDRTTDGRGRVADLSLAELRSLDAGRWFDPAFAGERVPTLEETLLALKGRARVLIDLKPVERGIETTGRSERLVRQCMELVVRTGMTDQVRFQSADPRHVQALARLGCRIPYDFLYGFPDGAPQAALFARNHGASGFNPRLACATRPAVLFAHGLGLRVQIYSADTEADYERAMALRVDGLITDRPADLAQWLSRRLPRS